MKLAWLEVEVGVEELPTEAGLAALNGRTWPCCRSFEEHQTRLAAIESWVTQVGGLELALIQAPLLLEKGPMIIDGWHRLCVARHLGAKTVRALYVDRILADLVW